MNNTIRFNFISVLIGVFALLLSIGIYYVVEISPLEKVLNEVSGDIKYFLSNKHNDGNGYSDVEGYGLIAQGLKFLFLTFGTLLLKAIFVWIPSIISIYILVLTIIATILIRKKSEKAITYKVIMGLVYSALVVMLMWSSIPLIIDGLSATFTIFTDVFTLVILGIGIKKTYFEKWKPHDNLAQ